MSRFRSTFLLTLVFVALFSYFWIYQKDTTPPEPKSDIPAPKTYQLAMYNSDDLSEISWKSASYSAKLQSTGEQKWRVVEPAAFVSDETKTKAYADSILALTGSQQYDLKNLDDKISGFNNPSLELIVKKKDGATDIYKFGNKTIDGDYYYVTKEGTNIVTLLGSFIVEDLIKDPQTLRPDPSPTTNSQAN